MRRGSIFVILFILVAAGVIGASQFLQNQPAVELTVAVSPVAEGWVKAAADSFNASNPLVNGTQRVQVRVQTADDPVVWQEGTRPWTAQNHPDGWIPALSASIEYAADARLPIEVLVPSTAQTPLVWGIFQSRASAVGVDGGSLDWAQVQAAAAQQRWDQLPGGQTSWGFVKLVFGAPERTASGLGVLLSGAAAFTNTTALDTQILGDSAFRSWMVPILDSVPNFNTLGADPAAALTRGPSAGEIALLPESQWLVNLRGIVEREPLLLSYPQYALIFDFPVALWNDTQTTDIERSGIAMFGQWLLGEPRQRQAESFGLRPANGVLSENATLFDSGTPYGIQLQPDLTTLIELPDRDAVLRALAWGSSTR